MNYRSFYLLNADSERFELTNCKQFFNEPSGLGFSKTYTTIRLGNSEPVTSEQFNLPTLQGDILFNGNSNADKYQAYSTLMKYLTKTPINIYYLPPNVTIPYFAEVNCIQIDKDEIDEEDSMLKCPAQFKLTNFWRTSSSNEIQVTPELQAGKKYPLLRETNIGYHYGGSSLSSVTLYNQGTLEAPLIIEITGECEDPQINLFQNDVQYGAIKLNGTFDHVLIDSSDDNETLELSYQGSELANPLSYQDLSVGSPNQIYVTFVKLKTGTTNLTVTFGATFNGNVKFSWRDTYVSV